MFGGIVVNVIHVALPVFIVADCMFPETPLPQLIFATGIGLQRTRHQHQVNKRQDPIPIFLLDAIFLPLRESLNDHLTTHHRLHRQLIAAEQAHTDEWVNVRSVHGNTAWSTIPQNKPLINVE